MKKIYLILITSLLALLLSACNSEDSKSTTKISVVACNNTTPIYTNIQDGDTLVKQSDSTVVTIVHNTDGSKKVCTVSGSAHLLRSN